MLKKIFLKILNRFGLLGYFNSNANILVNGTIWHFPILGKVGFEFLYIHRDTLFFLYSKLIQYQKIDTYIDVGCNIGQTLIKIKSIKPQILYHGFDMNSSNFYYLHRLKMLNQLVNTSLYPIGLSNEFGITKYHLNNLTDTGATIVEDNRPGFSKNSASGFVVSFDQISEKIKVGNNILIKIDVEGAELQVLSGMKFFLIKNRPIVVLEILDSYNQETMKTIDRDRNKDLMFLFAELKYDLYQISNKKFSLIKKDILDSKLYTKENDCDYVLWPCEKKIPHDIARFSNS